MVLTCWCVVKVTLPSNSCVSCPCTSQDLDTCTQGLGETLNIHKEQQRRQRAPLAHASANRQPRAIPTTHRNRHCWVSIDGIDKTQGPTTDPHPLTLVQQCSVGHSVESFLEIQKSQDGT